jgi:uncharacterized protein DUF4864
MRRILLALILMPFVVGSSAFAGEAEVKAAQGVIDGQLKAFSRGDNAGAYAFAAPTIKQMFPTVEAFMGMVSGAYEPVHRPKSYAFGKSEEMDADTVVQQLIIVGPDGKDYEAMYRLQRQPDGSYLINGVSLKASNSLST